MTYNFDPERWREMHEAALRARHDRGELTADQLAQELAELDQRYEEMLARLDGSFTLPPSGG